MRYIDSGSRDPASALGQWLQSEPVGGIAELRWQSGFFTADGLQPLASALHHLTSTGRLTHAVIGSNDGETLESDVNQLSALLGLPRPSAKLGVVSFAGAYYHPKVYHVLRADGSQAAYVGSANLTLAGVSSLHVEAGLILDTAEGDATSVLTAIADSVDAWFHGSRPGIELITDPANIAGLVASGILGVFRAPRPPASPSSLPGGRSASRPRLKPLLRFPPLPALPGGAGVTAVIPQQVGPNVSVLGPAVPQSPPYPAYVLFEPAAQNPTSGVGALSGATLPGGNAGIIIRLNRDSARHWLGAVGTSNISIPVPTVPTLRFGMFAGRTQRPRAEYTIQIRYLAANSEFRATPAATNVMVYGFSTGDTGHGDVRFVIPKPPAREIAEYATGHGLPLPAVGDVALLEWPTPLQPDFRLSVLDRRSSLFKTAANMLTGAAKSNQLVGQGACWLPSGISPVW